MPTCTHAENLVSNIAKANANADMGIRFRTVSAIPVTLDVAIMSPDYCASANTFPSYKAYAQILP